MPMPDFPAGAQKFQPITMRYDSNWSVVGKRDQLVPKTDTTKVFFFILDRKTRAVELTLSDADAEKIEWLDAAAGSIQVHLNSTDTQAIASGKKTYECWALLVAGAAKALVDRGDFTLEASAASLVVP